MCKSDRPVCVDEVLLEVIQHRAERLEYLCVVARISLRPLQYCVQMFTYQSTVTRDQRVLNCWTIHVL